MVKQHLGNERTLKIFCNRNFKHNKRKLKCNVSSVYCRKCLKLILDKFRYRNSNTICIMKGLLKIIYSQYNVKNT